MSTQNPKATKSTASNAASNNNAVEKTNGSTQQTSNNKTPETQSTEKRSGDLKNNQKINKSGGTETKNSFEVMPGKRVWPD